MQTIPERSADPQRSSVNAEERKPEGLAWKQPVADISSIAGTWSALNRPLGVGAVSRYTVR
jgi:hypothetical protein